MSVDLRIMLAVYGVNQSMNKQDREEFIKLVKNARVDLQDAWNLAMSAESNITDYGRAKWCEKAMDQIDSLLHIEEITIQHE